MIPVNSVWGYAGSNGPHLRHLVVDNGQGNIPENEIVTISLPIGWSWLGPEEDFRREFRPL